MDKKVLRQRSVDEKAEKVKRRKLLLTKISKLIKKDEEDLTQEDIELLEEHDDIVQDIRVRQEKGIEIKDRLKEWEEEPEELKKKCGRLADAISKSKRLVVYTGAGISTSANIPDYRGPNGVWTLLDQGKEVAACDLGLAQPTPAHMALFMLHQQAKISHIVSQNCDGLHLRSGIPRNKLSEVHGNMFIEICKTCKPVRPYVRLFDVTERTNRYKHATMRRCYICGSGLNDTIVHFGERGSIAWPINWNGASKAAEKADMILCLGSSLKVLRRYPWLWCMDRPVKQRPPLYIVNLQWTPKDAAATLKLNGRCDFVMSEVLRNLFMRIPEYTPYNDPLLSYATHLNEREEHTTTRRTLIESKPVGVNHISMEARISENGIIKEVRVENKFTWVGKQFQSRSRSSSSSESSVGSRPSVKTGVKRSSGANTSGSSSRSSRDSKSSSNQTSNTSSSTTSRNSSTSRTSDTDEDMNKVNINGKSQQTPTKPDKQIDHQSSQDPVKSAKVLIENDKPIHNICNQSNRSFAQVKQSLSETVVTNGYHLPAGESKNEVITLDDTSSDDDREPQVISEKLVIKYDGDVGKPLLPIIPILSLSSDDEEHFSKIICDKESQVSSINKNGGGSCKVSLFETELTLHSQQQNGSNKSVNNTPQTCQNGNESDLASVKEIELVDSVAQNLSKSEIIRKSEPISSNDLLMMTSPYKQTTNCNISNNHQSTNSLQETSGTTPFYTTITISPGKGTNKSSCDSVTVLNGSSIISPSNTSPPCSLSTTNTATTVPSTPPRLKSLIDCTTASSDCTSEVKTEIKDYGCDIKIDVSQDLTRFDSGFHSPPYQDHTYASPPHKQRRDEKSSHVTRLTKEERMEPLQSKLEHVFDESIPMTPPLTDEQVSPIKLEEEDPKIFSVNGITKIHENGLKTCPDSPKEMEENLFSVKKEDLNNADDARVENGVESLNGSVDMEEQFKEEILELVVKEDCKEEKCLSENVDIKVEDKKGVTEVKDEKDAAENGYVDKTEGEEVDQESETDEEESESDEEQSSASDQDWEGAGKHAVTSATQQSSDNQVTDNTNSNYVTRRYGLREKRGNKYNGFKEDILFKEQLLKAVKEEAKKEKESKCRKKNGKVKSDILNGEIVNGRTNIKIKNGIKIRDIEYRTIEWARDALYFSYEPNFLFLEDESGFVCDCCDPKTRRRVTVGSAADGGSVADNQLIGGPVVDHQLISGSSAENSEAEINYMQEDYEEIDTSYNEDTNTRNNSLINNSAASAPGWFGKGRRKRRTK